MSAAKIRVVGLVGATTYGSEAEAAVRSADVLVGSSRQLAHWGDVAADSIEIRGPLDAVFERVGEARVGGRTICVLASGDPGFFGVVRALGRYFGADELEVFPAPSSVALAFARLGESWDDAVVVSAHGRALTPSLEVVIRSPRVAILTSPHTPPQAVGRAIQERAPELRRRVAVLSRLGEHDESFVRTDIAGLAKGEFDPLSVVVVLDGERRDDVVLRWGQPEEAFAHRDAMITKSEVRAVILSKLRLPRTGVLWDVGAGSGSVGIECALLRPDLEVYAIERDASQCVRVTENAERHGVRVHVVHGSAPAVLEDLPRPERVFVGGGGLDVLDASLARLDSRGHCVASFAQLDGALGAWGRLGHLVQVSIARALPIGESGVRLEGRNPVFVSWGPFDE